MAESSIAKTSVKVTTDAKDARTGLEKFGGEIREWAGKQSNALGSQFSAALRGGLIGGFLGGSLQSIIEGGVEKFTRWASGADATAAAVASVTAELQAAAAEMNSNLEKAARWRVSLDREGQISDINAQLAELSKRWNEIDESLQGPLSKLHQIHEAEKGEIKTNLERAELEGTINAKVTEQNRIAGEMNKLHLEREKMEIALAVATQKTIQAKREEIETWGLAGAAAEEQLMRMRGHTEAQIKAVRDLNAELKRLAETNLGKTGVPFQFVMDAAGTAADLVNRAPQPTQIPGLGTLLGAIGTVQDLIAKAPTLRTDNAALVAGSSAEVSARVRNDNRTLTAQEQQLAEARKQSALLAEVRAAAADTAAAVARLGLAPLGAF